MGRLFEPLSDRVDRGLPKVYVYFVSIFPFDSAVLKAVFKCRRESVDYFCGNQQTPQRYRIEARIDAIADLEMTIQSNLQALLEQNSTHLKP